MDILNIIVLGIIQGIAEFLPISSSGHLAIASRLLGINDDALLIAVVLHAGSLVSVVAVYYKEIISLFSPKRCKLLLTIFVAIIPIGITGVLFQYFKVGDYIFTNLFFASCGLFFTGWLLLYGMKSSNKNGKKLEEISFKDAVRIGVMQCIAILPGVSRSGTTISTGLKTGIGREPSATFSFLIAIPVLLGAGLIKGALYFYRLYFEKAATEAIPLNILIIGFLVSAIVGYVALKFLISTVRKGSFAGYAYYCFTLGTIILVWQLYELI